MYTQLQSRSSQIRLLYSSLHNEVRRTQQKSRLGCDVEPQMAKRNVICFALILTCCANREFSSVFSFTIAKKGNLEGEHTVTCIPRSVVFTEKKQGFSLAFLRVRTVTVSRSPEVNPHPVLWLL